MSAEEMIAVGLVTTCHGINGELRVKVLTDFPERFDPEQKLFISQNENSYMQPVTVKSSRWHNNILLVTLAEVFDRTAAEALRGFKFWIPKTDVKPLPEGRFYIFDLEGLYAFDLKDNFLGELTEVLYTPAYDIYVVKGEKRELLVPALKRFVKKIDIKNRLISIDAESLEIAD